MKFTGRHRNYFEFRILPFKMGLILSSVEQKALRSFFDYIAGRLTKPEYKCVFDQNGKLFFSQRNAAADTAIIGLDHNFIYGQIRQALLGLQLKPEPPLFKSFVPPPKSSETLVLSRKPSETPEYKHLLLEVGALSQWCQDRWEDDTLLDAILEWHKSNPAPMPSPG